MPIPYTTSNRLKVLARMPNGIMRMIQINENTGSAEWVVHRQGQPYRMPGTYTVDEHGFDFHARHFSDHEWLTQAYVPSRQSYGPLQTQEQARRRTRYHDRLHHIKKTYGEAA